MGILTGRNTTSWGRRSGEDGHSRPSAKMSGQKIQRRGQWACILHSWIQSLRQEVARDQKEMEPGANALPHSDTEGSFFTDYS